MYRTIKINEKHYIQLVLLLQDTIKELKDDKEAQDYYKKIYEDVVSGNEEFLENHSIKIEITTPIIVEYKGYKIVSSGNFDYGLGSAYIVDSKGKMMRHLSLNTKPNEELLKEIITHWVDWGVK